MCNCRIHLPELFGILESVRTTIWGILAFQLQIAASLAGSVAVTLDLAPLALVAGDVVSTESFE
jgi:hypothetical protein